MMRARVDMLPVGVKALISVLGGLVAVALISSCSSGNPIPVLPGPTGPLPFYPNTAISINGDADFSAESAVVDGAGTQQDPYRIENMTFTTVPDVFVIVEDTTKPLVIRNLNLNPRADGVRVGIQLWYCENVKIENCSITGVRWGISVSHSSNISINGCTLTGSTESGIGVDQSSALRVVGNAVADFTNGIWLQGTTDSEIRDNTVSDAENGIRLVDCERVTVAENVVESSDNPYLDDQPDLNVWSESQDVASDSVRILLLLGVAVPACIAMLVGSVMLRSKRNGDATKD